MKKILALVVCILVSCVSLANNSTDVYKFRMRVRVPRIYDNTTSMGQRKWQSQLIVGEMHVDYSIDDISPIITFTNCYNKTHKIDGKNVTYLCENGYDDVVIRWVVMGSNKTGLFKNGSCFFYADFEPSYNIGEDEPDNSLLLYFGGYGTLQKVTNKIIGNTNKVKRWRGYCVGTMGCGCTAYGHISPTRVLGFFGPLCDFVTDVASIPIGHWTATYSHSY